MTFGIISFAETIIMPVMPLSSLLWQTMKEKNPATDGLWAVSRQHTSSWGGDQPKTRQEYFLRSYEVQVSWDPAASATDSCRAPLVLRPHHQTHEGGSILLRQPCCSPPEAPDSNRKGRQVCARCEDTNTAQIYICKHTLCHFLLQMNLNTHFIFFRFSQW